MSNSVTEKKVFITSTKYDGNLGGLAGADAKCQARASAGGLSGTYKAWLSDASTSAASLLTHAPVPYKMLNGTAIANDWSSLVASYILNEFKIDEFGNAIPYDPGGSVSGCSWAGGMFFFPWTCTTNSANIANASKNCSNWTTNSSGVVGEVGLGGYSLSQWTDWCTEFNCNLTNRLYCFEE